MAQAIWFLLLPPPWKASTSLCLPSKEELGIKCCTVLGSVYSMSLQSSGWDFLLHIFFSLCSLLTTISSSLLSVHLISHLNEPQHMLWAKDHAAKPCQTLSLQEANKTHPIFSWKLGSRKLQSVNFWILSRVLRRCNKRKYIQGNGAVQLVLKHQVIFEHLPAWVRSGQQRQLLWPPSTYVFCFSCEILAVNYRNQAAKCPSIQQIQKWLDKLAEWFPVNSCTKPWCLKSNMLVAAEPRRTDRKQTGDEKREEGDKEKRERGRMTIREEEMLLSSRRAGG